MLTSRTTPRLAPLTGIGSIVLLVVATLVIGTYEYLPDPEEIRSHYADNSTRVVFGTVVGILAAFLMVWFSGSVRVALRHAEGGDRRLSAVAFGGGVVAGAGMAAAYAVAQAAAARAGSDSGITPDAAATLYDISSVMYTGGMAMGLSVMIAAFAVVTLRTGLYPRWTAWVGLFIALGGVTVAWLFLVPQILWVATVSVALYRRGSTPG